MDWELRVGQVTTSNEQVLVLHDKPDFIAVEIDLNTKYAVPFYTSGSDEEEHFTVHIGERTIKYNPDESLGITTFTLRRPDLTDWEFLQEVGRYTWRIVGYRRVVED
jgi:hypothetical protein